MHSIFLVALMGGCGVTDGTDAKDAGDTDVVDTTGDTTDPVDDTPDDTTDTPDDTTDTTDTPEVPPYCPPGVVAAATSCDFPNGLSTLYEPSQILNTACEVVQVCEFGSMCYQAPGIEGGEATCRRSIDPSQADKPYYDFGCTFGEYITFPTRLEVDCRCRITGDGQGGAGGTGDALADPNNIDITAGARPGGPVMNCQEQGRMQDTIWPVQYGQGPSFNAWYQVNASGASWFSGDVDAATRTMYGLIKWTDPNHSKAGTIVAWNLDTGDRRVVSGIHPNLGAVGSGYLSPPPRGPFRFDDQPLTGANVLHIGPDGMIYTYGGGTGESTSDQREIVRTDPTTGERTLVWKAQEAAEETDLRGTYGQCLRPDAYGNLGSVALNGQSFAVAPDGSFYMGFRGVREGDGLIHVSADGSTCSFVAAWGGSGHQPGGGAVPAPPPGPIGNGPTLQFPVQGLHVRDGLIYGVHNDDLYAWDALTGDGHLVSTVLVAFGGMGVSNVFWDDTRDVLWAVGTEAPYVGAIIDPVSGRRESVFGDTGLADFGNEAILRSVYGEIRSVTNPSSVLTNGNSLGYGGFILDPADPDIAFGVLKSGGLMKMELSTFNSYVSSW